MRDFIFSRPNDDSRYLQRTALNSRRAIAVVIGEFVGILLTTVAYIHSYRAVRYHQNQIHSQLQQQNVEAMVLLREKKSAFNALYFYVIFVACYLPHFSFGILMITDSAETSVWLAMHATLVFVLLNSSLNPVVYCWRYREIRQIMKSTVKKTFRITKN